MTISRERREQIIAALRRGTVPDSSLDVLAVGLEPFEAALARIKAEKKLESFGLVKKSRLSVVPATQTEFELILALSETKL